MSLHLLIGGVRSGKSARAEELARASALPVRYIATAKAADDELRQRIAAHRARRPPDWELYEVEEDLRPALAQSAGRCLLLDGLGVWLAGLLEQATERDQLVAHLDAQLKPLIACAQEASPFLIVVAEQASEGVVPLDRSTRLWLDLLGDALARLASVATQVDLVVAGLPVAIGRRSGQLDVARREHRDGAAALAALRLHGDREVRPGEADHAVNVMAQGPPRWLRSALERGLAQELARYPQEQEACAAVARRHRRSPSEVLPTNGAAEALWLLPGTFAPRLAACVHPAFGEGEAALRTHGVEVARVVRRAQEGFAFDPRMVPEQADLVLIGNPASPCGSLLDCDALLALRRPGRVLVVDEAFMDFLPEESGSLADRALADVVVVRSLTKLLSIPGLRAGYVLAPAELIARMRAQRPPWSANALALLALRAACERPDRLYALALRAQRERADLAERLRAIEGLRVFEGAANFCLIEVSDGERAAAKLHERGFAVRPADSFVGLSSSHLRITAREPRANERLASALREVLRG
jgi:histidinol-phosphate/aromatic aminotransferase/cobyric acid decarboxylase-like protein/adenosyl cobinamide kinase/adenosyl cobinamide phosphate guanylyltransferase